MGGKSLRGCGEYRMFNHRASCLNVTANLEYHPRQL